MSESNIIRDSHITTGDYSPVTIHQYAGARGAYRPPVMKPPRAEHFTGRQAELEWLLEKLQPGCAVTICGAGGMGKTALVAEALWRLAPGNEPPQRFPDGIFYHTFYHQPQAATALEALALAFGETPQPSPQAAARRALAGRQALLFLDGTEACDDLPAVLGVRGGCGVVISTRRRSDAPGDFDRLPPLGDDDALRLLQAWGGALAADEAACRQICERVGNLPLAVRLAGRYLAKSGETAQGYLEWLQGSLLEALEHGERQSQSVPVLLARSVDRLGGTAQRILTIAGALALNTFSGEAAAAALELDDEALRRGLDELADYGLLLRVRRRWVVLHRLVHAYVGERCPPAAEAVERLAAHYIRLLLALSGQGREGFEKLEPERFHLAAVQQACLKAQRWQAALDLALAADEYLGLSGRQSERHALLAGGLSASRQTGDRLGEAGCLLGLGEVHMLRGEHAPAQERYKEALAIYRALGVRLWEAHCLYGLGEVHRLRGDYNQAQKNYTEAQEIYRALGDRLGEANCLHRLGEAHLLRGEYEPAQKNYTEAQAIYRALGDRRGEADCLQGLGDVHMLRGEHEPAQKNYTEALAIYHELGDRRGEANCLKGLGDVHMLRGEYEPAQKNYTEALAIYRALGARLGEANCLHGLGDVHRLRGEHAPAQERYTEAQAIYHELGDRRGEANCLKGLGDVHMLRDEYEPAQKWYMEALTVYRALGIRLGEAHCLKGLGEVHYLRGEDEQAQKLSEQAHTVYRELGDRLGEAGCLLMLGEVHHQKDETDQARGLFEQAQAVFRSLGFRQGEAGCLLMLGEMHAARGDYDRARELFAQARTITHELGDRLREAVCLHMLGWVYKSQADIAKARLCWQQAVSLYQAINDSDAMEVQALLDELEAG